MHQIQIPVIIAADSDLAFSQLIACVMTLARCQELPGLQCDIHTPNRNQRISQNRILTDRLPSLAIAYIVYPKRITQLLTISDNWDDNNSPSWSVMAAAISRTALMLLYCLLRCAIAFFLVGTFPAADTSSSIKIKIIAFVAYLC